MDKKVEITGSFRVRAEKIMRRTEYQMHNHMEIKWKLRAANRM